MSDTSQLTKDGQIKLHDNGDGTYSIQPYTSLATLIAGEDLTNDVLKIERRCSYVAISSATATVVKSGAGVLHRITVTGGTTGTIVIYDNTAGSGTKIADFDTINALASYELNVAFATGLTIVTSAATKITVSYR